MQTPQLNKLNVGLLAPLRSMWRNRVLLARLSKREIESRYRGSLLGLFWAILVPCLLLGVYTFVFSVVFEARWGERVQSKGEFSLVLFLGLIIFNLFSECISRAPGQMLANVSYIKKVVFPLEILPWVNMFAALFNALLSYGVLLLAHCFIIGIPPLATVVVPLLFLPVILSTVGLSLLLSSIGVFIRDLQQVVGVLLMVLMFLTPIFYPLTSIPERLRPLISASPLAAVIEESRRLLFWGQLPNLSLWALLLVLSYLTLWFGYWWFVKTKKGFADVI